MIQLSEQVNPDYIILVEDILSDTDFQSLEQYRQHISSNRLQHSINVSYLSWWLARKMNADECMAARAGLLHDFCMYDFYDPANACNESQLLHHPKVAAETSRSHFEISQIEYEAILTHMYPFGPRPLSKVGWIVSHADKMSAFSEMTHVRLGLNRRGRLIPLCGNCA